MSHGRRVVNTRSKVLESVRRSALLRVVVARCVRCCEQRGLGDARGWRIIVVQRFETNSVVGGTVVAIRKTGVAELWTP